MRTVISRGLIVFAVVAAWTMLGCTESGFQEDDIVGPTLESPIPKTPPAPDGVAASSAAAIGGVAIQWNSVSSVPAIDSYTVGYDTSPFSDISAVATVDVQHTGDPIQVVQVEGLASGSTYYVRIQSVDSLGAVSPLSLEVSAVATESFALQLGTMDVTIKGSGFTPVSGIDVVASANVYGIEFSTSTQSAPTSGWVQFTALPKIPELTVEFSDPSGAYYTFEFPPQAFGYSYPTWYAAMIPRGNFLQNYFTIDDFHTAWSVLDYLWAMSVVVNNEAYCASTDIDACNAAHAQSGFPRYSWGGSVSVHVDEHVVQGVDLRQLVIDALLVWNDVLGFMQFTIALDPQAADIITTWDGVFPVAYGYDEFGKVWNTGKSKPVTGHVFFEAASSPATIFRIALHEFGHILGLPHEAGLTSAMSPQTGGRIAGVSPALALITRAILRLPDGTNPKWYRNE